MEKTIRFKSDDYRIHGVLHLPAGKNPPAVVGSHGLLSSGESPKQVALAQRCSEAGIAFLRFDHRGCGRSEGLFTEATSFKGRLNDLTSAVETLLDSGETNGRIALFGSSLGGAVVLAAAGMIKPRALTTVAAPIRSTAIDSESIEEPGGLNDLSSLNERELAFDISDRVARLSGLLIFHGEEDKVVSFENALEIYNLAASPKELVRLEKGDHQMSDERHQAEFMDRTTEWFRSYL